jgi:hypothetical protein
MSHFAAQKDMTTSLSETAATLSSIEALRSYLVGVINAAAHSERGPKILLSYVGGEFNKAVGRTFEKHLTDLAERNLIDISPPKRKMISFIHSYCDELIDTERQPGNHYVVFPKGSNLVGEAVRVEAINVESAPSPLKFKRAVWAAFIRPISDNRRFLNLDQIGFTDSSTPPLNGQWVEIEKEFVLGLGTDEPVDANKLQGLIEAWASKTGTSISRLVVVPASTPTIGGHLKALFDIIDVLPPVLAAQWEIPAAVIKHLRQAR